MANKRIINFDLAITNRHSVTELVTPTFPISPKNGQGILALPALWAPYNFFNDFGGCTTAVTSDPYRWELFAAPLLPGQTTAAQKFGLTVANNRDQRRGLPNGGYRPDGPPPAAAGAGRADRDGKLAAGGGWWPGRGNSRLRLACSQQRLTSSGECFGYFSILVSHGRYVPKLSATARVSWAVLVAFRSLPGERRLP